MEEARYGADGRDHPADLRRGDCRGPRRCRLAFDGAAPAGSRGAGQTHRLRIIFSEARSADDLILQLLAGSKTPRDFIVITSDKSLGDKARHKGARVEKAHEFARRLDRPSKTAGPLSDKPALKETSEQIDAWLAVFDPGRK